MKLKDIVLVIKNYKGTVENYLTGIADYVKTIAEVCGGQADEMGCAVAALSQTREDSTKWQEMYSASNVSYYARFCGSEAQLRSFMLGMYNEKTEAGKVYSFDEKRCLPECLEVLKAYGIGTDGHNLFNSLHYKAIEHHFKRGEILHNLNGNDYYVLAVLSESNLLLMSQSDGQYIVANNTVMYERSPKEGHQSADSIIEGVEWGYGIYLGHDLMRIDLDGILQKYGRPRQINNIGDYHDETRWQFVKLKSMSQNTSLGQIVRWAAEKELTDTFGTVDREIFENNLKKGSYDNDFHQSGEERKEKSR